MVHDVRRVGAVGALVLVIVALADTDSLAIDYRVIDYRNDEGHVFIAPKEGFMYGVRPGRDKEVSAKEYVVGSKEEGEREEGGGAIGRFTIFFGPDQYIISDEERYALSLIAEEAKGRGEEPTVRCIGYTDRTGDAGRNVALAALRAESVAEVFRSQGLEVFAVGKPNCCYMHEEDHLNRRVEVALTNKKEKEKQDDGK